MAEATDTDVLLETVAQTAIAHWQFAEAGSKRQGISTGLSLRT
jgi:hypothetical protein